jgi:hypothetical protein
MSSWRRILCAMNPVVVFALLLQLIIEHPAAAYAAPQAPLIAPTPPAAPVAPAALPDVPTLLNLLVRQALTANGWNVVSLTSQLNPAAGTSAAQQSGAGAVAYRTAG